MKRFRCCALYEDISDGKGLAYHLEKVCGPIEAILYLISGSKGDPWSYKYEHGKRVEWATNRATEILSKKGDLQ